MKKIFILLTCITYMYSASAMLPAPITPIRLRVSRSGNVKVSFEPTRNESTRKPKPSKRKLLALLETQNKTVD